MKGKIDSQGDLYIDKGNGMRSQMCPYSRFEEYCGLHCSMFITNYYEDLTHKPHMRMVILCNGSTIYFEKEIL